MRSGTLAALLIDDVETGRGFMGVSDYADNWKPHCWDDSDNSAVAMSRNDGGKAVQVNVSADGSVVDLAIDFDLVDCTVTVNGRRIDL